MSALVSVHDATGTIPPMSSDVDAPAEVVFTVNGATQVVPLTGDVAVIEVVSVTPGDTIAVTVDALPEQPVIITVEES